MNPNTPVGCPQCGGQMDLGQAGRRLALTGLFASVTDWIEVDIYSCPACGRLAFFRTNFRPQPKKHVPVEPEPTDVDTAAFYVPGTGELVKCPVCGKRMLKVKGKNAEMLVCQDRECGHRETIARTSNARCPVCHKKMELRGKGDSQIFVCKCGYKEKLSSFKERRAKEGAGVSKKDVTRYLNQQKKEAEAPINSAFADAFAKLNLDKKK